MKNTKNFASRWGFILASVGSAVGMANVWGFPNKLGSNGGGAFLLIYLLFIFIFSYVGLPAEFAMGRHAATGTLGAYEKAWSTRGKGAGKALCRAFAALAAERGAVKMELKVFCRNAPALGLYEALGFRETKKYMERPL